MTRSSVDKSGFTGEGGNYVDGLYRVGAGDQMGYKYDQAGNLTEKGKQYVVANGNLTFTTTNGHWRYDTMRGTD